MNNIPKSLGGFNTVRKATIVRKLTYHYDTYLDNTLLNIKEALADRPKVHMCFSIEIACHNRENCQNMSSKEDFYA